LPFVSSPDGAFFEDVKVGREYTSPGRTVTETDVVLFAGLSGDYNVLHTDAEHMKGSLFGERIAHGLLGLEGERRLEIQSRDLREITADVTISAETKMSATPLAIQRPIFHLDDTSNLAVNYIYFHLL